MNPELQLRDIHLPAEIGWWPPAYGWWIVCLLILLGLYFLFKHWRSNRKPPQIRPQDICKPALRELQRLETEYANEPVQLIRELSILLRRSAMSLYGRHYTSGISGDSWLAFLDQQGGNDTFSEHFHRMLTELPYREHNETRAGELADAVRDWLHIQQQTARPQTRTGVASLVGEGLSERGDFAQSGRGATPGLTTTRTTAQQRGHGHV